MSKINTNITHKRSRVSEASLENIKDGQVVYDISSPSSGIYIGQYNEETDSVDAISLSEGERVLLKSGSGDDSIEQNIETSEATGTAAISFGKSLASGAYSFAHGGGSQQFEGYVDRPTASGMYATAEGAYTEASGKQSHAEGRQTKAIGECAHAEGMRSVAQANNSHAEGQDTTASGDKSHAEGYSTTASERYAHAEGYSTVASGACSHAEGDRSVASNNNSHAEGGETVAAGTYSHAEGISTVAAGNHSHSEGQGEGEYDKRFYVRNSYTAGASTLKVTSVQGENVQVKGLYSGQKIRRNNDDGTTHYAVIEGVTQYSNYTELNLSTPFDCNLGGQWGLRCTSTGAQGENSHAEGHDTLSLGNSSHAEGNGTRTTNEAEHAEGTFNVSNRGSSDLDDPRVLNTRHSIGIGNASKSKNAFEIMESGDAYLYGVGGYDGTNPLDATPLQNLLKPVIEPLSIIIINPDGFAATEYEISPEDADVLMEVIGSTYMRDVVLLLYVEGMEEELMCRPLSIHITDMDDEPQIKLYVIAGSYGLKAINIRLS